MAEQRRPRVLRWIQEIQAAGADEAKAKAVFNSVRDDPDAKPVDRDHFHRVLAQQMFVQFLEATRGQALSPAEVQRLADEASRVRAAASPSDDDR